MAELVKIAIACLTGGIMSTSVVKLNWLWSDNNKGVGWFDIPLFVLLKRSKEFFLGACIILFLRSRGIDFSIERSTGSFSRTCLSFALLPTSDKAEAAERIFQVLQSWECLLSKSCTSAQFCDTGSPRWIPKWLKSSGLCNLFKVWKVDSSTLDAVYPFTSVFAYVLSLSK